MLKFATPAEAVTLVVEPPVNAPGPVGEIETLDVSPVSTFPNRSSMLRATDERGEPAVPLVGGMVKTSCDAVAGVIVNELETGLVRLSLESVALRV